MHPPIKLMLVYKQKQTGLTEITIQLRSMIQEQQEISRKKKEEEEEDRKRDAQVSPSMHLRKPGSH